MTVIVYPNPDVLAEMTVARLLLAVADAGAQRDHVHVAVAGGSVGTQILGQLPSSPLAAHVDWQAVHIWWVDERFVPATDADRNDAEVLPALHQLPIPPENIHSMPALSTTADLKAAKAQYARTLAQYGEEDAASPVFDVVLLGMGPDGHIASIFPTHEGITAGADGTTVFAIENSPKPPTMRLSLTLETILHARHVWVAAWGQEKAPAIARGVAGEDLQLTPAAAVSTHANALWLTDVAGASSI